MKLISDIKEAKNIAILHKEISLCDTILEVSFYEKII